MGYCAGWVYSYKPLAIEYCFFPGFQEEYSYLQGYHCNTKQYEGPFQFDHPSLDKCRSKWHITSKMSKHHIGGPKTLPIEPSRVLWFGMSIFDERVLRVVKKVTLLNLSSPSSDIERRKNIFIQAIKDAKFPIITLNSVSEEKRDGFIHFGVIVGDSGFEDYLDGDLGFPHRSPYWDHPPQNALNGLSGRTHRLSLSSTTELQITTCILPGPLKTSVLFTGHG